MWVTDSDPTFVPHSHPPAPFCLRSPGSSLYADRRICAFSVCFYCVLKGWGAGLCFTWNLNPSQIKTLCPGAIYYHCLLSKGHRVCGAEAGLSLHISNVDHPAQFNSTVYSKKVYHPQGLFLPPFYSKEEVWYVRRRSVICLPNTRGQWRQRASFEFSSTEGRAAFLIQAFILWLHKTHGFMRTTFTLFSELNTRHVLLGLKQTAAVKTREDLSVYTTHLPEYCVNIYISICFFGP